jgi:hypothetical protein
MMEWISVNKEMPSKKCLAFYTNELGKCRIVKAKYVQKFTEEANTDNEDYIEYDEKTDCYYTPEGWYECIDNWEDYTHVFIYHGEVTHWMPLPSPPITLPDPTLPNVNLLTMGRAK